MGCRKNSYMNDAFPLCLLISQVGVRVLEGLFGCMLDRYVAQFVRDKMFSKANRLKAL